MIHRTHLYTDQDSFRDFAATFDIRSSSAILIQIFTGTISQPHIREMQTMVSGCFPEAKIIGCTTAGEICDNKTFTGSTVISVTVFERTQITTGIIAGNNHYEIARTLASSLCTSNTVLAICLSAGINAGTMLSGQQFCAGFNSVAPDIPIAGGLCGDNAMFKQGYLFDNDQIIENGAVVAVLKGKFLKATSCFNLGWRPLGKTFTITGAKDDIIFSLDNIPAAEVLRRYFGIYAESGAGSTKGFVFPLYTIRHGIRIASGIISANPDNSLTITTRLSAGEKVCFSYGGAHNLFDTCLKLQRQWNNVNADAVYMYSCACRKWNLPQVADDEVKMLYHDIPTVGFFSYGEFFHSGIDAEFMNFTQTMIALKEERTAVNGSFSILREVDLNVEPQHLDNVNIENQQHNLRVLDQLVSAMTGELMELNRELEEKNLELRHSLEHIKTMQGLLPICANCKKIRDDQGYWHQVENYIRDHSDAECTHGVCPECFKKLYPDIDPDKIFSKD